MAASDVEGTGQTLLPMLTVAAVARRLGVAPSTLRTWDRRYKVGPSAHTAGSHRRYSPTDVERLVVMRRLTLDGVPPAEAAQIALSMPVRRPSAARDLDGVHAAGMPPDAQDGRRPPPQPSPVLDSPHPDAALADWVPGLGSDDAGPGDTDPADTDPGDAGIGPDSQAATARLHPSVLTSLSAAGIPAARRGGVAEALDVGAPFFPAVRPGWPAAASRPGGGRVVPLPDGSPQARGLARAAMSLDTREVTRLLQDAVAAQGVVHAWDAMAMPVLHAIGERWRASGDGVDVEHAFSEAVLAVMRSVSATLGRPSNTNPVLLTCAEGDYHTLPLHALAAALAERGIECRMLGVGMPPGALVAAVRRTGPSVVFLYARLPVSSVEVLELLPRQRPAPRVLLGGTGWHGAEIPPSAVRVQRLTEAVDQVLNAVQV